MRTQESSDRQTVPEVSGTVTVETENGIFHLSYGKCELCPERATLLDLAKQMYHVKLTEGTSAGATSHDGKAAAQESIADTNQHARGWALKQTKKAGRFSETEKKVPR